MSRSEEARRLLQGGRVQEAERLYEQVLTTSPDDIEALNVTALACLRRRELPRATELLEHAARLAPEDPATLHHLGCALERAGDLARAMAAHAAAVRGAPQQFVARLHWASCLERLGDRVRASVQYKRALDDAQRTGQWLSAETTPAALLPLVQHAVRSVRRDRRVAFEHLIEPLAQRYGRQELARVERCIRILLAEEPPVYSDPRQRPSFLYFPGLPTSPYFERSLFPWIEEVEGRTDLILHDLQRLLPSPQGLERAFRSEEIERRYLRGTDVPPSWNGYYFYRDGERRSENCERCAATAAALDALPLARISRHAPEVMFSVLTTGTHLTAHRGVTNTRSVAHLPLIVPPNCALSVGGEVHAWREGRVVVFDDTYEHEAWNRSPTTRVVLIFDIWNPFLAEVERAAIADIVAEMGEFRLAVEAD